MITSLSNNDEIYWVLESPVICDSNEPGIISRHVPVPVNHSMGLWVW